MELPRRFLSRHALACALLLTVAARAESTAEDPDLDLVKDLASVNVTANKMEQSLLDVPASISVIDATTLEEKGIQSVNDLLWEIPNLVPVAGAAGEGTGVNMRGINTSLFTNNNPVVIYIDGIAHSSRYGFDASLANVERIEVLRGPQGTLYGKDAIGGVINIVTRRPDNTPGVRAGFEYGTDAAWFGTFNLSGALQADTLWWGINGQMSGEDGWIENEYPGMRRKADPRRERRFNGFMLYQPSEQFSARLSLNTEASVIHWLHAMSAPSGTPLSDFSRVGASRARFDVDAKGRYDADALALALGWTLPGAVLESVSIWRKYYVDSLFDTDFAANPDYLDLVQFNVASSKTLSQEFRASSRNDKGARWVAGVYLEHEDYEQGPFGVEFPDLDPATGSRVGAFMMNAESLTKIRTGAVFGQVMAPLADGWELTLGGRWQQIEKEIGLNTWLLPSGVGFRTGPPIYSLDARKTWSAFLPKAALNWRFHPQWSAHVSFAEGYMPGGFNSFITEGTAEENRFEAQTSRNFEIGIKGGAGALTLGVDLFYMEIGDIHIYKTDGVIYSVANARKAHSQGVEVETAWTPRGTHLEFNAVLGMIEAKYDDYDAGVERFDGEHIESTPTRTLRLSAAWVHPGGIYARLDVRNQGHQWVYDNATRSFPQTGGYTVLDARAGLRRGAWEVYGAVRNLTDREYLTGFISNTTVALANFGNPRRYSLGLRYVF